MSKKHYLHFTPNYEIEPVVKKFVEVLEMENPDITEQDFTAVVEIFSGHNVKGLATRSGERGHDWKIGKRATQVKKLTTGSGLPAPP